MKPIFADSLAGTDRQYVVGRARIKNDVLHVQIGGPEANRTYGFCGNFYFPPSDLNAIAETDKIQTKSLATSNTDYFLLQATPYDDGVVHFQVPGDSAGASGEWRREYGLAFDVADNTLHNYLKNLISEGVDHEYEDDIDDDVDKDDDNSLCSTEEVNKDFDDAVQLFISNTDTVGNLLASIQEVFELDEDKARKAVITWLTNQSTNEQ